jgi:regulator of protease activity HflC (stomatin/prohibitin superfamily)
MNISGSLAVLALALFGGLIAYVAWVLVERQNRRPRKISVTVVLALLVGGVAAMSFSAGTVFIEPQERGIVISALSSDGYRKGTLGAGLQWIVPYAERVQRYLISQQTYTMSGVSEEGDIQGDDAVRARTNDGQEVFMDASVIFSIDPNQVDTLHILWQDRYVNGLVRPQVRGVIREAVAQFNVQEVYSTKRTELHDQIESTLQDIFAANGLLLRDNDFIVRNITFTPEYADAIERKQIAEQDAERAKFLVEQQKQEADRLREEAKGEKDAAITRAEGEGEAAKIRAQAEAESLRLVNEVLAQNPDLLQYKYIEKLASNIEVMMLPGNSPYLLDLPGLIQGQSGTATGATPNQTEATPNQ